jgi:hypothetical protein
MSVPEVLELLNLRAAFAFCGSARAASGHNFSVIGSVRLGSGIDSRRTLHFLIALSPGLAHNFGMLARVCLAAVNGIEGYPVEVEVNAGYGDTIIVIVGLPDAAVKESRDGVMTALINSGFNFTFGRTTINLAPADVKKEGPSFDLPIAIGRVAASQQMASDQSGSIMMVGELALGGAVRPVEGVRTLEIAASGGHNLLE